MINSVIYLNIITRRDVNLLPLINEFIKEFISYYIISLVDLYSGYDQMLLHFKSRDLIVFFISFNIKLMILINYVIELIAPYNYVVFRKSLNSVKNIIKSLFLR